MPKVEDTLGVAREHEHEDCVLYLECLHVAARGTLRKGIYKSGDSSLPCRGCTRYTPEERRRPNPWGQPSGYVPWGGF